jgi:hypothetical protein
MNEAITEKFSKKKGRPARPMAAVIAGLYQDDGKRSQNNKAWMITALHALGFREAGNIPAAYAWLLETTPAKRWKRGTLLSELGRLGDPQLIQQVAATLCKQKPKVTDAVIMVRGYRRALTGKQPAAPDCIALTNEIINTINSYMTRYPEITTKFVLTALQNATDKVQEITP